MTRATGLSVFTLFPDGGRRSPIVPDFLFLHSYPGFISRIAPCHNVFCTSILQRLATAGSVLPRSLGRDFSASLLVFPFLSRLHLVRFPFDPFFSARFRFCDVDGRSDACPEGSVYIYCPIRVPWACREKDILYFRCHEV